MNKARFVSLLRSTADQLKPLTRDPRHQPPGTEEQEIQSLDRNSYALVWRPTLDTIAIMLDAQDTPLSTRQIAYLSRLLFGGMGILNDLRFNTRVLGDVARQVNEGLDQQTTALFDCFQDIVAEQASSSE